MKSIARLAAAALFITPQLPLQSQSPAGAATREAGQLGAESYDRRFVMIPMRDGVKLNTEIFVPKDVTGSLPILYRRTPYGVGASSINAVAPNRALHELARDGYIFAFQDIRGRYKSEGQFVMQRA